MHSLYDAVLDEYEEKFRQQPYPDWPEFLNSIAKRDGQLARELQFEIIAIDLEHRLRRQLLPIDSPFLPYYLDRIEDFSVGQVADLFKQEWFIRASLGQGLAFESYLEACSSHSLSIQDKLELAYQELIQDQSSVSCRTIPADISRGSRIGVFTLSRVIGEGGMGIVYEAEQHEPVRRKVAVKVIRSGMVSKEVMRRFDRERQTLAMMDHPNIAKLFDAGMTNFGCPYFAMELVQGTPINEYCRKAESTSSDRLDFIVQVCHAVQHAHQKGIIHRDIKPGNTLVAISDGRPFVKIIDFGIAKAVEIEAKDVSLVTHEGSILGTLRYMSPEQASGCQQDVDVRSDVYSIGIMLYELLTGTQPLAHAGLRSQSIEKILHCIRCVDPPRPSELKHSSRDKSLQANENSSNPRPLSRGRYNELDWIVMKAIAKDPAQRYASAAQLAEDIERFQRNEVVCARPPSRLYRLRKSFQNHTVAFSSAIAIVCLLLVGCVTTSLALVQANQAIHAARGMNAADIQLLRFLGQNTNRELSDIANTSKIRRQLLQRVQEHLAAMDPTYLDQLDFGTDSIQIMLDLGDLARSHELTSLDEPKNQSRIPSSPLDTAYGFYQQANEIAQRLELTSSLSVQQEATIAFSYVKLAEIEMTRGNNPLSENLYCRALERVQNKQLAGKDNWLLYQVESIAIQGLGRVHLQLGDDETAIKYYRRRLTMLEKLRSNDVGKPELISSSAEGCEDLGNALAGVGQFVEACEVLSEAIQHHQNVLQVRGEHRVTLQYHYAKCRVSFGEVYLAWNKADESLPHFEAAKSTYESLASDSSNLDFQRELIRVLVRQAHATRISGDYSQALEQTERAVSLARELASLDPDNASFQRLHAIALTYLHSHWDSLNENAKALEFILESLEIQKKNTMRNSANPQFLRDLMSSHRMAGLQMRKLRNFNASMEHLSQGVSILNAIVDRADEEGWSRTMIEECKQDRDILGWELQCSQLGCDAIESSVKRQKLSELQMQQLLTVRCELLVSEGRWREMEASALELANSAGADTFMLADAAMAFAGCAKFVSGWSGKGEFDISRVDLADQESQRLERDRLLGLFAATWKRSLELGHPSPRSFLANEGLRGFYKLDCISSLWQEDF